MKDFSYYLNAIGEVGYVDQVTTTIIYANGLPGVKPGELVVFENGELGQTLSFTESSIEILVFSKEALTPGTKIVRTNEFLNVPVGPEYLGKIISPLGNPLEGSVPQERPALSAAITTAPSGITSRITIKRHFSTGAPIVDLVLPLGYGQKELVIGDRKTGKTDFLLQTVLTQARLGNICVYAAIGKRKLDIKKLRDVFYKFKILDKVVIVASGSQDPIGLIYLTPYSAMTLAEYFRDQGNDVLIVLDDLSTHAKFYREISLLGKRFPGRNSYPGDIFYTHASLMERAGNFVTQKGEKAITCLPVAETVEGDLSGYIQTNLMSMTDGHLFFDSDLFTKGRRPAVNPFLSVTRVGRQTQSNVEREMNREILSFLTLFEKMQRFAHFGGELNETIKVTLSVGQEITKFFQQAPSSIMPINVQIFLFCFLWITVVQKGSSYDAYDKLKELDKIIRLYDSNAQFRKNLDEMIKTATSFNNLLGIVRQRKEELLGYKVES
jgi:F-type H+/Na+-transporting ATPase subunit alpha